MECPQNVKSRNFVAYMSNSTKKFLSVYAMNLLLRQGFIRVIFETSLLLIHKLKEPLKNMYHAS